MILSMGDMEIDCTKAVKGVDYIRIYDGNAEVASFKGITDFSGYALLGGDWSAPAPTPEERIAELEATIDALLGVQNG